MPNKTDVKQTLSCVQHLPFGSFSIGKIQATEILLNPLPLRNWYTFIGESAFLGSLSMKPHDLGERDQSKSLKSLASRVTCPGLSIAASWLSNIYGL